MLLPNRYQGLEYQSSKDDLSLLSEYHLRHDQQAFAELVSRYLPLVYGVCRRVLGMGPSAEDATQATFMILAQSQNKLRTESLSSWLYGVAYKSALFARRTESRRQKHEQQAAKTERTEPALPERAEELRLLDEELTRLHDDYRVPLILCFLQGRSHRQVANELGCQVGTISSRVSRGKALLKARLIKRGVAAATVATILGPVVVQAKPSVALLTQCASMSSSQVIQLITTGVMRTMVMSQAKFCGSAVTCIGLMLLAGFLLLPRPVQEAEKKVLPVQASSGVSKTGWLEGQILDAKSGNPVAGVKLTVLAQGSGGGRKDVREAVSGKDGKYSLELPIGHAWLFGLRTPGGYYIQDMKTYSNFATTAEKPRVFKYFMVRKGASWKINAKLPNEPLQHEHWLIMARPNLGEEASGTPQLRTNETESIMIEFNRNNPYLTIPERGGKWILSSSIITKSAQSAEVAFKLESDAEFDPGTIEGKPEELMDRKAVRLKDSAGRSAIIEGVQVTIEENEAVLQFPFDSLLKKTTEYGELTLSGTAVDHDGKPLAKARCVVAFGSQHGGATTEFESVTDESGNFKISKVKLAGDPSLYERDCYVLVNKPGFVGANTNKVKLMDARESGKIVFDKITLQPGFTLRGKVLDEDGKPVHGALVTNHTDYFLYNHLTCRTDEKGEFSMADLPQGKHNVGAAFGELAGNTNLELKEGGGEQIIRLKMTVGNGFNESRAAWNRKDAGKKPIENDSSWDLTPPRKEPKYQGEPRYAQLVFGPKMDRRVWMVLDGNTLYVDTNGNGDLTEPGKRIVSNNPKDGSNKFGGSGSHTHFDVHEFFVELASGEKSKFVFQHWIRNEKFIPKTDFDKYVIEIRQKHRLEHGTLFRKEGQGMGQTPLSFLPRTSDTQVVSFDGPLTFALKFPDRQVLERAAGGSDVAFNIGGKTRTPPSADQPMPNRLTTEEVPKEAYLEVEAEFPGNSQSDPPIKRKYLLKERC